ncbi:hypothetical protein Rhal01_03729 [Rubritalea halochordaticola]|uniref:PEP-CTERM sorting domain-containing protein n=1 Tax=Rubritalea halochordaticola TaxID=714537 RepID=A0ABP9V4Q5_9BACT
MNRNILQAGVLLATTGLLQAASLSFDFEAQDLAATTSGSGFSVTDLAETGLGSNSIYGDFTTTTMVRAYVPGQITNGSSPAFDAADYVQFGLTAGADGINFSGSSFSTTVGGFTSAGSGGAMGIFVNVYYSLDGGANWSSALGSTLSINQAAYTNPGNASGEFGFDGALGFDESHASDSYDLSSLGTLASGEEVLFRIAINDNSGSNVNLTSGNNVKGVYLDDITVSDFTASAVPEPGTSTLLLSCGALALLRRRR